jgi:hemolysin activation/secretion protein
MERRPQPLSASVLAGPVECRALRRGASLTCNTFLAAAAAIAFLAGASAAIAAAPDGDPAYPVSRILLRYSIANPSLPDLDEVMSLEISLGATDKGYVGAGGGGKTVTLRLKDIGSGKLAKVIFHGSAIRSVGVQIVRFLNRRGVYGVAVSPDPDDIPPETGKDLRPEKRPAGEQQVLRLVIYVPRVTRTRTIASGERIPAEARVDNPAHAWIKENSPIRPSGEPGACEESSLFRKELLDDYLFELDRLPGRRVDAAISSGVGPGDIELDYLVNEGKPWLIYYQLSNTGTKRTSIWRDAFGFTDNQLTGHDDTLALSAVGSGVKNDDTRAVSGSYEFPILRPDLLRLRLYGSWSKYSAADLGFGNARFIGADSTVGAEVIANIYQHKQWFLDAVAGARWHYVNVENQVVDITDQEDFFIPGIGLRLERTTPAAVTAASLSYEGNIPAVAHTETSRLPALGRLGTDSTWQVVKWNARQSLFLEPLLSPRGTETTLAHEVVMSFRGQLTRNRLIPQEEEVVGGLYSVRGYPEADAVGDTVMMASLEYDCHIPRLLSPKAEPVKAPGIGDFRVFPPQKSVSPDWDFIIRPFLDYGQTWNSDIEPIERNETLVGTGIGAELEIRRNLAIRVDWGIALSPTQDTKAGSSVVNFVLTLSY